MVVIKLEDSMDLTKEPQILPTKRKKTKRKLRSLVKDNAEAKDEKPDDKSRWNWKYFALPVLILIASLFLSEISISSCGFWATYENNYNKIVYGDERHCYRTIESSWSVSKLKERVVGQDEALSLIEGSLDLANREKIIQMAFVGGTGVGKTLSAEILTDLWRWNVFSSIFDINFSMDLSGEAAYKSDLEIVMSQMKNCGFNLIVIDDVDSTIETIERIAKLERNLHRIAKLKLFKIVLVVIFKGEQDSSALQEQLKDFVIIDFHPLTEESFKKCVEIHQKLHNVTLKPRELEELMMINFNKTGCKTVAKKLKVN